MTPKRLTVTGLLSAVFAISVLAPANALTHTVRQGDSLWRISQQYKVSVSSIARANGLSENATLSLGKKITIPGSSTTSSAKTTSRNTYPAVSGSKTGVVIKTARLRSGPATTSRIIASLPVGKQLVILGSKYDWLYVKTASGTKGYVGNYLVKINTPVASRQSVSVSRHKSPRQAPATRAAYKAPASSAASSNVARTAAGQLGSRYRFGGTSRGGFDCSGFTRYVYAKHGVSLPHNSSAQYGHGKAVSKSDLQPGDLVFFATRGMRIGHVGVYEGNGMFIHASNPRGGVRRDSVHSGYYGSRYVGARRVK